MNTTKTNTQIVVKFELKHERMIVQEAEKSFETREALLSWIGTRATSETEKGHTVYLRPGFMAWTENGRSHQYTWLTKEGKTHQTVEKKLFRTTDQPGSTCPNCKGSGDWVGRYQTKKGGCFKCKGTGKIVSETQRKEKETQEIIDRRYEKECYDLQMRQEEEWKTRVREIEAEQTSEDDESNPFTE